MGILENFPITAGSLDAHGIRKCVGKDDPIIVEVGANCGQTTLEMLEAMPRATIYAFEPDPRAIAKFRSAIHHPNVHLYECAIGAENGTITFNQSSGAEDQPGYSGGWDQSGSIRRPKGHLTQFPWVKFEEQITVPIMTLDSWSEQHQIAKADFIWADVQGAESDLALGGAGFLNASRYLYTEYSNDECYEGQISLPGLLKMLPNFELVLRFEADALLRNTRERLQSPRRFTYPQFSYNLTPTQFIQAPLQGKLSVARVFWLYGIVGSLVYGCLEFFIDPGNTFLMRLYTLGGGLYSAYVIVGTYRCAVNCATVGMARFVRISCILSLLLLPILTYMELSGMLSSDLSQIEQLNL